MNIGVKSKQVYHNGSTFLHLPLPTRPSHTPLGKFIVIFQSMSFSSSLCIDTVNPEGGYLVQKASAPEKLSMNNESKTQIHEALTYLQVLYSSLQSFGVVAGLSTNNCIEKYNVLQSSMLLF